MCRFAESETLADPLEGLILLDQIRLPARVEEQNCRLVALVEVLNHARHRRHNFLGLFNALFQNQVDAINVDGHAGVGHRHILRILLLILIASQNLNNGSMARRAACS